MKFKLFILTLFWTSLTFASGFKTFVPTENGYQHVKINIEKKTINDICNHLGYNSDQFYTYFDTDIKSSNVFLVIFKVFTDDIICVLTDDTVSSISKRDVTNYLTNFNLKKEFDSYKIESTLSDGVKNKSLTEEFLEEIFNQTDNLKDNSIIALNIGYELYFINGILTKYITTDGLSKWSKMWKNEMPSTYFKYENSAKQYWINEENIIKEINVQSDAFSRTPDGVLNEYIKFHANSDGTINYKMLLVAHYDEKISLGEFKGINKGRYSLSTEFNNKDEYKRTTYRVNKGLYTFDGNGYLVNAYTSD
ncbi:hypothetical protein [Zobellia barbeyronii]|uniref:TPM domain-containing protein n=1 Tax=Zobellia barbeyronii TaxID=2748009 RepID=A0ABS5WCS8_9FLAO|nr:hypothetical protein [Zobellia barbeyronii]MBT2160600.1 hypothetical protein [Zobellia barbeyronii]